MKTRFFWLKSDRKTVQELSHAEYDKQYGSKAWKRRKYAVVWTNGDFLAYDGDLHVLIVPARQFRQILALCKEAFQQ